MAIKKYLLVTILLATIPIMAAPHLSFKLIQHIGTDDVFFLNNFSNKINNPDNTKMVLAFGADTFRIVATESYNMSSSCRTGHTGRQLKAAYYSPNGSRIVTTASDGEVKVWDTECKLLATLRDDENLIHLATFGKNENEIITNSHDNINKIWVLEEVLSSSL